MFDSTGALLIDDGIGELVNEVNGSVDDREIVEEQMKKIIGVANEVLTPRMEALTKRVHDEILALNVNEEDLPELRFEPSDDLERELYTYIMASLDNTFETIWKRDLHYTLDHTLDIMLQGGLVQEIAEEENDEEVYNKWKAEVEEHEKQVPEKRAQYYQKGYENLVTWLNDDDMIMQTIIEDPRVIKMVRVIENKKKGNLVQFPGN